MRIWNASDANVYIRLKFAYVVQVFNPVFTNPFIVTCHNDIQQ